MFSEAEVKQVEDIFYNLMKKENILQKKTGQTTLEVETDIPIEECDEEYMKKKGIACWYFSNNDGKSQNIRHDQLFIFENGKFTGKSTRVLKALPFTLIEAYQVWEMYFEEERKVTDIYVNIPFKYSPKKSDIQFIIWALRKGKCDWMLENTKDYRYDFDFKKFIGISK